MSSVSNSFEIKEVSILFICILNLEFYSTKLYHSVNSKKVKRFLPRSMSKDFLVPYMFLEIFWNESCQLQLTITKTSFSGYDLAQGS